jgi:hypothetical protein
VPVTTFVWLAVTMLTKPEPQATLVRFYERVRPAGLGWRPIARVARGEASGQTLLGGLVSWVAGCGLVYGTLFGIGKLILGSAAAAAVYLAGAALCGAIIAFGLREARPAAGPLDPQIASRST